MAKEKEAHHPKKVRRFYNRIGNVNFVLYVPQLQSMLLYRTYYYILIRIEF